MNKLGARLCVLFFSLPDDFAPASSLVFVVFERVGSVNKLLLLPPREEDSLLLFDILARRENTQKRGSEIG